MLKRKTMVLAIISYGILTALTVIRALGGGARGPGRAENHPTDIFEGAVATTARDLRKLFLHS